jgi:hypothetical protein
MLNFSRPKPPPPAAIDRSAVQLLRDEIARSLEAIQAERQAVDHLAKTTQSHVNRQAQAIQAAIVQIDRYWVDVQHQADMAVYRANLAVERAEAHAGQAKEAAVAAGQSHQGAINCQVNPLNALILCALVSGFVAALVVVVTVPSRRSPPRPRPPEPLTTRSAVELGSIGRLVHAKP